MAGRNARSKAGKGRHGEPWMRSQTGTYHITIDGKKINLQTSDKAEAYRKLESMQGDVDADPYVSTIIDKFIEWSEKQVSRKRQGARTLETNSFYLLGSWSKTTGEQLSEGFKDFVGDTRLSEFGAQEVADFLDERFPDASQNTRGSAVKAIKRVFSWATNSRGELNHPLISVNPIKGMKVPSYVPKRVWITDEQWATVCAQYDESDPYSDALRAVWLTGVRPQELRLVEAHNFKNGRWEFAKGKGGFPRIVTLVPEMVAMTERLIAKHPTGPLFRNRDGKPWTAATLSRRLVRLKRKMRENLDDFPGFNTVEDVDKITLYSGRKTYIASGIKNGVDPVTMRHLAGHKSTHMIDKVYASVEQDLEHMQAAARKVVGDG